jgi:uncharacterized protein
VNGYIQPPFERRLLEILLALNNAHAEELSYRTLDEFQALLSEASYVRAEAHGLALLVAFNERCNYDNPNFHWLRARFSRFNYIDRVVVQGSARGLGHASALYEALEAATQRDGRERLVCEINLVPPNAGSDAFHRRLGFRPVGKQRLEASGKTVRYWAKELV